MFLLSIQDMDPVDRVFEGASRMLKPGSRIALLMTHPCFRPPKQSGWGWDRHRKLHYRRVDRYLTPFVLPNTIKKRQGAGKTVSFHRPLEVYINGLARCGLSVDRIEEVPADATQMKAVKTANNPVYNGDIPLFLGIRTCKRGCLRMER